MIPTSRSGIAFPADRALWQSSRRLLSSRPASDGRYAFPDVPPGEYSIAVLADLDPDDWKRPAFLEQVIAASTKVTIADGASVRQDLKFR